MLFNLAKKIIRKFFSSCRKLKGPANPHLKANIVNRAEHGISRSSFSKNVLKVLYRLKSAGFDAYLVGGCIRDILLDIEPKDFDVVTNAKPNQVRKIFGNCRLIGRRFPLAHVYFRNDIIEVATLRADETKKLIKRKPKQSEHGMILRDNVFGHCVTEDVLRRDFTINALYYNIKDFSVIDYVGGLKDIKSRTLRLIGDPLVRYKEDPVRMLRVVRFAAKLDLKIAKDTEAPIFEQHKLLEHISPARLFEEYKKLFLTGYSFITFKLLIKYNLLDILFPHLKEIDIQKDLQHKSNQHLEMIINALKDTDSRLARGKTISPGFLLSAFLWEELNLQAAKLIGKKTPEFEAYKTAMETVLRNQSKAVAFPKKITLMTREVWMLQLRLRRRAGKAASRVFNSHKFRAGYDFLKLRATTGFSDAIELLEWWDKYIAADERIRWQMAKGLIKSNPRRKKSKE